MKKMLLPSLITIFALTLASCSPPQGAGHTPTTTSTPSPSPSSTPPTPPNITTPGYVLTNTEKSTGVYGFLNNVAYYFRLRVGNVIGSHLPVELLDSGDDNDPSLGNPNDAFEFAFSNYADLIAFWTSGQPGELWLSDLANNDPRLVFIDSEMVCPYDVNYSPGEMIDMRWTFNDMHLFINVVDDPTLNMIYHLQNDTIEAWPYNCDRVAMSSRSGRLATWCVSNSSEESFAILEWGGEIWFSEASPLQEIVRLRPDQYQIWAWSSDGEQLAYFDPADPEGYLYIANVDGEIRLQIIPGAAYWTTNILDNRRRLVEPPSPPIQWSQDNSRLVIFAHPDQSHQCPTLYLPYGEIHERVPCWQVIDTSTGEVIWTISDSINGLLSSEMSITEVGPYNFEFPTISPDGQLLVIQGWINRRQLNTIDLQTNEVTNWFDIMYTYMRWGPEP
ncbi:MAG: hypothetical protein FVQ83_10180 [Chloroflexi bacterium]|nr:hypothetical protein [Chloroflexota bacterium]